MIKYLSLALVMPIVLFTGGCANSLMLFPGLAKYADEHSPGFNTNLLDKFELVVVKNDFGNEVKGFLHSSLKDNGTVIVSGGNTMSVKATSKYYRFLLNSGFRVLYFSFQGYDDNLGEARLESLIGDSKAFYNAIAERYPGEKIIYMGDSISSSVALCLPMSGVDLSGIIVEGAFNPKVIPYSKVKQLWYFFPLYPILVPLAASVSFSVPSELDTSECIKKNQNIPILFIHDPRDVVTPFDSAIQLYIDYAGSKKFIIPRLSQEPQYHMSLWRDLTIQKSIVKYITKTLNKSN